MPFKLLQPNVRGRQDRIKHFPFEITVTSNNIDGTYALVRPGTVTGMVPANIFDKIYISDEGTFYIKLTCQTNGKIPTYLWVFADTNAINNSDVVSNGTPPPDFQIILGVIVNKVIYQVVFNNIIAKPGVMFVEPKFPDNPAMEPFTRWWGWQVSYF